MKRILLITLLMLLVSANLVSAAVPKTINYQGRLTDTAGNPVADGSYSLTISIYDQLSGGSPLWSGVYPADTKSGYFNLVVGGPPAAAFPVSMDFSVQYWLEVKVGADPAMTPRQALNSVPYAIRADVATNAIAAASATNAAYAVSATSATIAANATNAANADLLDSLDSTSFIRKSMGDVGSTDVAAGAVDTQAKAPWAPLVAVQGAWRNNPIIACGREASNASGNAHIDLTAYGFTQIPVVICTPKHDTLGFTVNIATADHSTTGFGVYTRVDSGVAAAVWFEWIAIGY